ncbi:MAG: nucleotide exchange factor GrpE [Candidatus Competibacteraceae bacterium]
MPPTESTLDPHAHREAAEVIHPSDDLDAAPATEDELEILMSREEIDALQRGLDQALDKADEHWKRYLGAHAEMDNLRKRTERDVQNAHKFALERFLGDLLPVRDSLELGLMAADGAAEVTHLRAGLELTLKQLVAAMEKSGACEVNPAVGAKFNPAEHEAMAMMPTDQQEPNTVAQVVQKGYRLNERLIRPAKVIVTQIPPKSAG